MKKTDNQEAAYFLFRKMWKFSKGNRKMVVFYIILAIVSRLVLLIGPALFGIFLNLLQTNGMTEDNIVYLSLLLFGGVFLALIFWLLHGTSRIIERRNAFKVTLNYKKDLFNRVLAFDISWHTDRQSGDSIDKIDKATKSLFLFSENTFEVISIVIRAIGTVIALMYFSLWISLGVSIGIAISLYIIFLFDKRLVPLYKRINSSENKISAKIYDSISNITSIIILKIRGLIIKDIEKSLYLPEKAYYERVILNEKKWFVGDTLFNLITAIPLVVYLLIHYNQHSIIEIGTISALFMYLSNLNRVFFGFGGLYSKLIQHKTDIENASEIENAKNGKSLSKIKKINFKSLKLQKLSFSYKNTHKNVLKNINLKISSGEKIALIGASGSGKTTFLKLLHGLHDFTNGKVFINGEKEFKSLSQVDLKTTLVPQEPELFTASIEENITFGVDVGKKELQSFIDMACFTEALEQLPNGLESKVNEKGVNLSGGQKQRLALARALLFAKKKKIILLDESTSSVDPENETQIYKNILEKFSEKTIISSIHKMNLLKFFDRIIMFENGEIVDDGSFKYLLENNMKFSKMWGEFSKK